MAQTVINSDQRVIDAAGVTYSSMVMAINFCLQLSSTGSSSNPTRPHQRPVPGVIRLQLRMDFSGSRAAYCIHTARTRFGPRWHATIAGNCLMPRTRLELVFAGSHRAAMFQRSRDAQSRCRGRLTGISSHACIGIGVRGRVFILRPTPSVVRMRAHMLGVRYGLVL